MELYRNGLKLTATIGLDESRGSVNVPVRLLHNENDEYLNYTEQIHIRYLFDNQVKEEILPTNDNGFYIPGKPLSHDGPIELAVHLINGDIELVTNELLFVVKNAPNGTTQVDPSEFTWQQLVDQYVNAKLDTFANKSDLSKFEEKVNGSVEKQNKNLVDLQNKTRINYFRPTLQTQTVNGVTITNNGDGTYTLNGTASSSTDFYLQRYINLEIKEDCKFIALSQDINGLSVSVYDVDNVIYESNTIIPKGKTISFVYIYVQSGAKLNNVLVKPMITDDLSATYDDFVSGFDCFTPDLKVDKLWVNASPYSPFGNQAIGLDLRNYQMIIIDYIYDISVSTRLSKAILTIDKQFYIEILNFYRGGTCAYNYIDFDVSSSDNHIVPINIYGVR